METLSALLALWEGNPPVTSVFPLQRLHSGTLKFSLMLVCKSALTNRQVVSDSRYHDSRYHDSRYHDSRYHDYNVYHIFLNSQLTDRVQKSPTHRSHFKDITKRIPEIFLNWIWDLCHYKKWCLISKKTYEIVIHGNECIILFLTCYCMSWTHNSAKNNHRSLISKLSPKTVVSDLELWRHHSGSVTSCEREILALWRHIRQLFSHAQIGAKAILTSE